ncbi:MAG TPA: hypothetical protein VFQ53_17310 [Kofleriaceae bacterium]|nr:hypothetical protein [Kofleriaceae bacterium]
MTETPPRARHDLRLYAALFALGLVVYGLLAWSRLGKQSGAPHFVYQADAWLHGSIAVEPPLPADDWAVVETVVLDDGTEVSGRRMVTRKPFRLTKQAFRALDGREYGSCLSANQPAQKTCSMPGSRVRASRGYVHFVSFPPVPSLIMLPSALISGRAGNDVIPTIVFAALIVPLTLLLLRRLADAGHSTRTLREDLWLVALLAFGSVLVFSSVQGKVWYTAHVVGVVLALVYAWASIEARHPAIAGVALGLAALTRTSMAFMFPIFVFEVWRMAAKTTAAEAPPNASASLNLKTGRKQMWVAIRRPLLHFAIPIVVFAILGMLYNYVRFHSPTEFGHTYLALGDHRPVRQQTQIETWGLASYHYLSRNLSVALTLLPELLPRAPWVQISGHGLALWVTTPALLMVVWPRHKGALHLPLWLTVLFVALPSLFYMNSGWVQFGYRFSLDYLVFLVMLIAIGGRPLTSLVKTLIVLGIAINLFGAITFDRDWKYYRVAGNAYDAVVAN